MIVSTAGSPTIAAPCLTTASIVRSIVAGIDQRPHRIMHQHHIVVVALQRRQRIAHRLLPMIAALDHMDPRPQLELLHLRLHPLPLLRPHRDANRIHSRHLKKRLHRAHQHRHAANLKNCFGAAA